MITIVRAVQTCWMCPAQWDAWTDLGDYVYLRFRHGYGSALMYDGPVRDDNGFTMLVGEFSDDDPYAGAISLVDFCRRAGIRLALTSAEEVAL